MMSSSAGRSRSFCRLSRGFAIAPPNADDPPRNRTKRRKAESQFARKPALNPRFLAKTVISDPLLRRPAQRLRGSSHGVIAGGCSPWSNEVRVTSASEFVEEGEQP